MKKQKRNSTGRFDDPPMILNEKHALAITAIASGKSITATAKLIGEDRALLYRWMKTEVFSAALKLEIDSLCEYMRIQYRALACRVIE